MIRRAVGLRAPPSITMQLFNTMSRSIIEYCSPVWSPSSVGDIQRVERLQRGMTRYAMHYPDHLDYKQRCIELDLLPLSYRREIHDLTIFFKGVNGLNRVNFSQFSQFYSSNGRRTGDSGPLLRIPLVRTECFSNSYFNQIVRLWNARPSSFCTCDNLDVFKRQVSSHYKNLLVNHFNCTDLCTWRANCRCQRCLCTSSQTIFQ